MKLSREWKRKGSIWRWEEEDGEDQFEVRAFFHLTSLLVSPPWTFPLFSGNKFTYAAKMRAKMRVSSAVA